MSMSKKDPEPEIPAPESEDVGNIPKPVGELFNLPIYKKGDVNQAGELGKAVKIDKTVRVFKL